jgi:hypothetical protein
LFKRPNQKVASNALDIARFMLFQGGFCQFEMYADKEKEK